MTAAVEPGSGRQAALAYLRLDPQCPNDRSRLLEQVASSLGELEQLLLALVDLVDDVALTHMDPAQWDGRLGQLLRGGSDVGVTPVEFAGHKRALALLLQREAPREARRRMAAGAIADERQIAGVIAARLAQFIDLFHAADRAAWVARLDERIAALAVAPSTTKES